MDVFLKSAPLHIIVHIPQFQTVCGKPFQDKQLKRMEKENLYMINVLHQAVDRGDLQRLKKIDLIY